MVYFARSEAETEALGARLARDLSPGTVLAYRGGLGAGKTAFTRGVARGLGYAGRVTSPTFAIVNEYEGGRLPLFHFDLYRLDGAGELFDIGWEDYLDRGGVCAVEWSERAEDALPSGISPGTSSGTSSGIGPGTSSGIGSGTIVVTFSRTEEEGVRRIEIVGGTVGTGGTEGGGSGG